MPRTSPTLTAAAFAFAPVKRTLALASPPPSDERAKGVTADANPPHGPRRSLRVKRHVGVSVPPADKSRPSKKPRLEAAAAAAKIPMKTAATPPPPASSTTQQDASLPLLDAATIQLHTTLPAPSLPFSLSQARSHLCTVDPRFRPLFDSVPLTPFEELESGAEKELDLFKRLVTSILGQQVSWLAARAIIWRFCALFDKGLPSQPDWSTHSRESLPFPRPLDVLGSNEGQLRTAGLSGAKARYVLDIARRFADGRLDVRQIVKMDEEEMMRKLCEIKGVGPWTAQMMLLFSLRRPDILPVGDLGVQRGMLLLHTSDGSGPAISEAKKRKKAEKEQKGGGAATGVGVKDVVETLGSTQGPVKSQTDSHEAKINVPPLAPASGLTHASLKARLTKKAKGNVYLTPNEMEALAEAWRPYRSVASFFMWAIVDQ